MTRPPRCHDEPRSSERSRAGARAREEVGRASAELACRVLPTDDGNGHAPGGNVMSQTLPPRSKGPDGASRAESSAAFFPAPGFVMPVTSSRTLEADGIRFLDANVVSPARRR